MAFPTNANQVQAFAGALYGVQVGATTLAQVTNDIQAAGGLTNALNGYYSSSFGSKTTASVASTVAANLGLTGTTASSATDYITGQLNAAPAAGRGAVIANILNLFSGLTADATYGTAATAWNAKVDVAAAYKGTSDVAIGTVVASASSVFALTTNSDAPGSTAPAVNTFGTTADDTYSATFSTAAGADNGTLNNADSIDGQAGTDTLNIRIVAAGGSASSTAGNAAAAADSRAPAIANVEKIQVTNIATGTNAANYSGNSTSFATAIATLNLTGVTGLTEVGVKDSASTTSWTEFAGVANGTRLVINNGDGNQAFNMAGATSRTGTADALNLTISNGSGTSAARSTIGVYATLGSAAAAGATAVEDATYETLNIATTGAASFADVRIGASTTGYVTTVTVTGDGAGAATTGYALDLGQTGTTTSAFGVAKIINASGMTGTGGLYIRTANAADLTFTGSAQNDRLDIGAIANLTVNDKITFAGGTDTLGISDASPAVSAASKALIVATGAEQLAFTSATFSGDSVSSYTGGPTTFIVDTAHTATSVAFTGVSSATTIRLPADITGTVGANGANGGNAGVAGTAALTLTGASVGTVANLALTGGTDLIGGGTGSGTASSAGAVGVEAIAFGGSVSTLVINSTGTTVNTITGAAASAANTAGNGANGGVGIANGTSVVNVTITGTQNLSIQGGAGTAGVGNGATSGVTGHGFSGAVNVNAADFTGRLQTSLSASADVLTLGSGGSRIDSSAGADSLTLGSGVDQITISLAASSLSGGANNDTVTGFTAGTDKFIVAAVPAIVSQGAAFTAAGTGTLATDIGSALTAGGLTIAVQDAAIVTITGIGAGTYLIYNDATAGYSSTADTVVRLVGTVGTLTTADFAIAYA